MSDKCINVVGQAITVALVRQPSCPTSHLSDNSLVQHITMWSKIMHRGFKKTLSLVINNYTVARFLLLHRFQPSQLQQETRFQGPSPALPLRLKISPSGKICPLIQFKKKLNIISSISNKIIQFIPFMPCVFFAYGHSPCSCNPHHSKEIEVSEKHENNYKKINNRKL